MTLSCRGMTDAAKFIVDSIWDVANELKLMQVVWY